MGESAVAMKPEEPQDRIPVTEEGKPDVLKLMATIRAEVKDHLESTKDKPKAFRPSAVPQDKMAAGTLLYSEELRYLNTNYSFGPNLNLDSISSHRPGIIGKSIVKVKRKLLGIIWDLLKDYFTAEREFQANLVRHLNQTAKYVDSRDASNFWDLIRKIDVDVTKALERIERIHDEQTAAIRSSERRVFDELGKTATQLLEEITAAKAGVEQHAERLRVLDAVTIGLEGIIARISKSTEASSSASPAMNYADRLPDFSYVMLENRYRGSEEAIKKHVSFYVDFFRNAPGTVLEIGPGRGELLELFKEQGIAARGLDYDQAMVEHCTAKGLEVVQGDAIEYLMSLSDKSLGGLIAVQVVEHLTREQLLLLCEQCARTINTGGRVIFETINPRS
ncbi:MAG: methyltransferase domain-containing protein, partial [Bdellovibrionales bacterium]|nr:methyltransferase domain-containing protein [Bdellovibrionales bacterium]